MKVDARGLDPATTYWYRFRAQGTTSPAGRTRTAPAEDADVPRLRMAVVSCANMQAGWFTAYRHLAERRDLDLVVHLGDYFYEYGPGRWERPDRPAARPAVGDGDARRLPAPARPVQGRCRPAGAARRGPVGDHLGRPRVGQRRLVRRCRRTTRRRRRATGRSGGRRPSRPTPSGCRCGSGRRQISAAAVRPAGQPLDARPAHLPQRAAGDPARSGDRRPRPHDDRPRAGGLPARRAGTRPCSGSSSATP